MNHDSKQEYWDDIGRSFNAAASENLWRSHSDRVNRNLLAAWLGKHRRSSLLKTDLFDEAVSKGLFPCLEERADEVSGIDISPQCVEMAGRRYPGFNVSRADVRDLPFEDGRFDCIFSNSTLDHFDHRKDIVAALSELFRVLRPGGELIVTLDNLQNPLIALRNALPFEWLKKLGLVPYFVGKTAGRRGLTRILNESGFIVDETKAILHCPRVLAVPLARRCQERSNAAGQQRLLEWLAAWERLADWPTAGFTGHFIAALARKPKT
ncbi:MAG: methyltransferase domain-containing protein [Xanthomonadales bacterium]|nr:methyltransferase domain-containing protein [Xanthomonadales bacterium]